MRPGHRVKTVSTDYHEYSIGVAELRVLLGVPADAHLEWSYPPEPRFGGVPVDSPPDALRATWAVKKESP